MNSPYTAFSSPSTATPEIQPGPQDHLTLDSVPSPDLLASPSSSSAPNVARSSQATVPAACLACRGKHLKCDGRMPCGRCRISDTDCVYVASRRGYKGPRKHAGQPRNNNKPATSSPDGSDSGRNNNPLLLGATTAPSLIQSDLTLTNSMTPSEQLQTTSFASNLQLYRNLSGVLDTSCINLSNSGVPAQFPVQNLTERCLDLFYHHLFASHPFVLPKDYLLRVSKEMDVTPLLAVMNYLGSLFLEVGFGRSAFLEESMRLALDPSRPKDGFLVQALILLVVALDGGSQQAKARHVLAAAEEVAIQIGLNSRDYTTLHGQGNAVMEESWRRTWWDLFVVDGMIAGVHRETNFLLFDISSDVGLPCEEYQYISGAIPQTMYLEDLDYLEFSGEDREFSSFAYRILAARNLGRLMRSPPIFGPDDPSLNRIEALLTNWRMHLPASKRDALTRQLHLDEMMFQAHMICHATSIILHQPHSQLDSSPTHSVNACAPHRNIPSGEAFNTHTRHTIASAAEVSRMVTHRTPLLSHTHFFACILTLSSIVHLSRWAMVYIPRSSDEHEDDLRQQIRLNIGALSKMSEVWKSAGLSYTQVRGVAQEIYRSKKSQQVNPGYWVGLSQDEMMSSIDADESIMSEIESLQPPMASILPGV